MKTKFISYLLIVSLVMTLFSTAIMAEDKKIEFMKKRIKIVPHKSAKTIVTEKENALTYYQNYGYFSVATQTGGGETVKINPSRIIGYDIYTGGRKISDVKFLKIIGKIQRAENLQMARKSDQNENKNDLIQRIIIAGIGTAGMIAGVSNMEKNNKEWTPLGSASFFVATFGALFGPELIGEDNTASKYELSFREVAHLAEIYNRKLMNELGLEKNQLKLE